MDLQAENCAKCGCLPDDILTLTCNHDLCLSCASKNLHREAMKYGDGIKSIMCELCGAPTILDDSSIEELLRIPYAEGGRDHSSFVSSPKQIAGYSPMENRQQRNPLAQSQEGFNKYGGQNESILQERPSNSERRNMRAFCIEHPDEEISYFCFDCLANCICPECIIHGIHKNHEVLTVKKSYGIVKNKVEDTLHSLSSKLDEEKLLEDKFNNSKREMKENNKVLKKQVSDIFQEIRQRVDKKEKEVLATMDTALEDAIREVDLFMKTLENKAASVNATFDLVKNHLTARDEILLLNFYANNHSKLKQQLDSEEINFKKLNESYVPKVPLNFNEVIDSLNILQVQISAIGNVSAEKFRNYPATPEYSVHFNTSVELGNVENKSRMKRDPSKKDYYPSSVLSNTYTHDTTDKSVKQTNFRNFQLPSSKANTYNKNPLYSAMEGSK